MTTPSIVVVDQKLQGNAVSVSVVSMPEAGTLAVFASDTAGQKTQPPIGFLSLQPGDYRDVLVNLMGTPNTGDKLWAVLEKPGSYMNPIMDGDKPVEVRFVLL